MRGVAALLLLTRLGPVGCRPAAVDVVVRDELLAPAGSAGEGWIEQDFAAEIDGRPGAERVVRSVAPIGEGAWEERVAVYRGDQRLGEPIVGGGYLGAGYALARDLDGDGRDELVLVGDTDGSYVPSDLSALSWTGQGWRERIWGLPPGVGVEIHDVDGDERLEIIGLSPGEQGVEVVVLRPDDEGLYRPGPPGDLTAWLPILAMERIRAGALRPDVELALLVRAAGERGLRPPQGASLQPVLEANYRAKESSILREPYVEAMAWAAEPGAAAFLLGALGEPEAPQRAIAAALCQVGEGEAAVAAVRATLQSQRPAGDLAEGVIAGCGAAAVEPVAALARDESLLVPVRADLIYLAFDADPGFAPHAAALAAGPEPGLRRPAAFALGRLAEQGRLGPVPVELLLPLLADPEPNVRLAVARALAAQGEAGREALEAALGSAPERREILIVLLDTPGADLDPLAALARESDPLVRGYLHRRIAEAGAPAAAAAGLAAARGGDEAGQYRYGLAKRAIDLADPGWHLVVARLADLASRPDPRERQAAAEALGLLDTPASRAALERLLASDEEVYVRGAAAASLGRLPGSEAPLEAALAAERARAAAGGLEARGEVLLALGDLGTPQALAIAARELGSADPSREYYALKALSQPGGADALAAHVEGLAAASPPDCRRQAAAVDALLGAAVTEETQGALLGLLERCPEGQADWLPAMLGGWPTEKCRAHAAILARLTTSPERAVRSAALAALAQGASAPAP